VWLFNVSGDAVEFHADRTRGLPGVDPKGTALVISCAAALFFLRVAIRHFGYTHEVRTFPNPDEPDLLAEVRLGAPYEATAEGHQLFEAIMKRRTNRSPFQMLEIPQEVLDALETAATEEGRGCA